MIASFAFLIAQFKRRPYFEDCQNNMQILNLAGITMTLFCANMLKGMECNPGRSLGPGETTFWEVTLLVINVSIFGYMVYKFLIDGLLSIGVGYARAVAETKKRTQTR